MRARWITARQTLHGTRSDVFVGVPREPRNEGVTSETQHFASKRNETKSAFASGSLVACASYFLFFLVLFLFSSLRTRLKRKAVGQVWSGVTGEKSEIVYKGCDGRDEYFVPSCVPFPSSLAFFGPSVPWTGMLLAVTSRDGIKPLARAINT